MPAACGKNVENREERKMANGEMTVKVTAADLPVVRANVRALDIVIGLIGGGYPKELIGRFINECVDLKQDGLLDANMMFGVQYIGSVVGTETYQKLVEYLAEQIRKDDELARAEEEIQATGTGAYNGGNSKCYVETADKVPNALGDVYTPGSAAWKNETDPADKIQVMTRKDHADLHSAGRKNGPGVKTAEKIRKATNAPVKKAGATRKATTGKTGGAADGK